MKKILLTKGKSTIVDDEDFEMLNKYHWHYMSTGYAARRNTYSKGKTQIVLMHRIIMNVKNKYIIDHINRDKLDNRKINLRISNKSQNSLNSKIPIDNTSGYKGVGLHKMARKWRARITINGKEIHLGLFYDKEEAILVRQEIERRYI